MAAVTRLERPAPTYVVHVERDHECGMFIAECPELHVFTEAPTLDSLHARVWEIAPDMIEANGLKIDPASMRLRFEVVETRFDRIAL